MAKDTSKNTCFMDIIQYTTITFLEKTNLSQDKKVYKNKPKEKSIDRKMSDCEFSESYLNGLTNSIDDYLYTNTDLECSKSYKHCLTNTKDEEILLKKILLK